MRTKVDERREREEYDRAHPWLPLRDAIIDDGVVCELLFANMDTSREVLYFLGIDDRWYRVEPPGRSLFRNVMNWRPTYPWRKLSPRKRAEIIQISNQRDW